MTERLRPARNWTIKVFGVIATSAVLLAAGVTACDKVPLLAPSNSTINLTASTRTLPLNGSTGLTAFVTESSGTPVQNGTTVRFTTTLGAVSPVETQTTNGLAVANFLAGGSSGIAEVHAISGGAVSGSTAAANPTNVITITIGAAAVTAVGLQANPATVPANGGSVDIIATVTGGTAGTTTTAATNLPLAGIDVSFSTSAGTLSATTATTNSSGQAHVTLTTVRKATVTASVGSQSKTVDVTLNPATSLTLATSPATPTVGQAVILTMTPVADTAPSVIVFWGDGATTTVGVVRAAQSVSHAYRNPGSYAITVNATEDGASFSTSTAVTIAPAPSVTLSVSPATGQSEPLPNPPGQTNFVFTVTPAAANGVKDVTIDFGDGTSQDLGAITSAATVSHKYSAPNTYTGKATEVDGAGNTTSAVVVVTVS